ncbi:MAG: hydroxysqualene dehydroxylase HpnE [Dechloromonas sp.]|nr:hydroxysqualene dehydroxylase HpnE [Dechloromonas sp.]
MQIAVVGAGWAGLAAAVELIRRGSSVTLFEAGRVAGGRARAVEIDGRRLDNGQHILLGAYHNTLALMRQVGADPDQLLIRHPLQISDSTGFKLTLPQWPAPWHVAWGLLRAHPVKAREKIKTARWMQGLKWRRFKVDPQLTVSAWLDAAGQTGQLRHHLWEPLCLAALNTPAEHASAQLFAHVLRDSLGSTRASDTDLLLPRDTLSELLPDPACRWLLAHGATLHFSHRVQHLSSDSSGVQIDGQAFDGAILAVAPQHLARLWPDTELPTAYEPIATVYLQFSAKTTLPYPLYNASGKVGQWVVDRGNGLLACVLSGHGDWEKLTDDQLATTLQAEMGLTGPVHWQRCIREKRATFSCRPQTPRPRWQTTSPAIRLAGDASWHDYPATLEGAVRSGQRAAQSF